MSIYIYEFVSTILIKVFHYKNKNDIYGYKKYMLPFLRFEQIFKNVTLNLRMKKQRHIILIYQHEIIYNSTFFKYICT
jgi:hypothetical protein